MTIKKTVVSLHYINNLNFYNMKTIFLFFNGWIEGETAICNIGDNCKHSNKPKKMYLPSEYCKEVDDCTIKIEKKLYNKLIRSKSIIYEYCQKYI